ncbi:hypothetical protein C8J56DRAFT_340014 [Mycena floridula]|nr:hypothetical protein C8J56DRAFT_340014 [Mycena floridula]
MCHLSLQTGIVFRPKDNVKLMVVRFIFPELLTFGNPMIPNQFDLIPFLAKGSGPWLGGIPGIPQAATGPIVGQLSPWPGVLKPALIDCPFVDPSIPVANAGSDIIVSSTADVTLVGTIKNANLDPEGVEFEWSQVSGIDVDLVNATSSRATFKAPSATSMVALTFSLNTTNAAGSTSDNVTVTVVPGNQVVDRITFETATWKAGKGSGTLTVIADSNIEGSQLILSALDADMSAIPMTSLGGGRWEILVSIRPAPTSVTVTSSFGGFAQTLVT